MVKVPCQYEMVKELCENNNDLIFIATLTMVKVPYKKTNG